jgi:hypothetical protein
LCRGAAPRLPFQDRDERSEMSVRGAQEAGGIASARSDSREPLVVRAPSGLSLRHESRELVQVVPLVCGSSSRRSRTRRLAREIRARPPRPTAATAPALRSASRAGTRRASRRMRAALLAEEHHPALADVGRGERNGNSGPDWERYRPVMLRADAGERAPACVRRAGPGSFRPTSHRRGARRRSARARTADQRRRDWWRPPR